MFEKHIFKEYRKECLLWVLEINQFYNTSKNTK